MNMAIRIIIVAIMTLTYVCLFKYVSGTLSLKKLNMNSLTFYFLLIFCFVGANAVFLGFRDHYLIQKCTETVIEKTYWIIMYALIALPLYMISFQKLMGIHNFNTFFKNYAEREINSLYKNEKSIFVLMLFLTSIGAAAVIYTFRCIGYIPLLELLKGNFSSMTNRVSIAREFTGNQYIRNIFALTLVPSISYIAYIYCRTTKSIRWKMLFTILAVLSVLCKTYAFEKAPVILYVAYFYLIEVMLNKTKKIGKIAIFAIFGISALLFMYYVISDYAGSLFTLSSGPMSRLFMTQIATCYLHVQTFPSKTAFLGGASFSRVISWIFRTSSSGIRSGRVVMEYFNASAVANGTAGVMNSLYIAEAYANFGIAGVISAPVFVAFFITVIPCWILKQEKQPINMALYIVFTSTYANTLIGGYVDFFYSVSLAFVFIVFMLLAAAANGGRLKIRIW